MSKTGFESGQEVRFIESNGEDFPAYLLGVDEFDMQRPGVYSDGEYFPGDGSNPTKVSKQTGQPHKIISRAIEVMTGAGGLNAGEGASKKVIMVTDLAIDFGNDKGGKRWIIKRNVMKHYDVAKGAVIPPSPGYLDLDEFSHWKTSEQMQEEVRKQRLDRLMNPDKYLPKPEFQQEQPTDGAVPAEGEVKASRRR